MVHTCRNDDNIDFQGVGSSLTGIDGLSTTDSDDEFNL